MAPCGCAGRRPPGSPGLNCSRPSPIPAVASSDSVRGQRGRSGGRTAFALARVSIGELRARYQDAEVSLLAQLRQDLLSSDPAGTLPAVTAVFSARLIRVLLRRPGPLVLFRGCVRGLPDPGVVVGLSALLARAGICRDIPVIPAS
jgi:hypothetical protein